MVLQLVPDLLLVLDVFNCYFETILQDLGLNDLTLEPSAELLQLLLRKPLAIFHQRFVVLKLLILDFLSDALLKLVQNLTGLILLAEACA